MIPTLDDFGSNSMAPYYSSAVLHSLSTSNLLAENVAPRGFTAELGTVPFAFDTSVPAVVSVSVFDATGTNLVWNTSVTNSTAGTCYPYWSLLDNAGNPVPLPNQDEVITYRVVVSATTATSSSDSGTSFFQAGDSFNTPDREFPVHISRDPHAGHTATFYNHFTFWVGSVVGINESLDDICFYIWSAVCNSYTLHPWDSDGYDRSMNLNAAPKVFSQLSDFPNFFYDVLTNQSTGQFVYMCHSDGYSFGSGTFNDCTYNFYDVSVAPALGNSLNNNDDNYAHRVRMAELDGCYSGLHSLNYAFGSPDALNQKPGMTKSAFLGWATYGVTTGTWLPNTPFMDQIQYFHFYWTDMGQEGGPGIREAVNRTFDALGCGDSYKQARVVKGDPGLTWYKTD
jgi:hypothetical protein